MERRARDIILDRLRDRGTYAKERAAAHEQGHAWYPEGEGTEIELFDPNWLENVRRTNPIYNQSVSTEEDPRLGVD